MAKVIEGEQQQNKDDDKEPLSCFQRYLRGPGPAYSLVFVDFFGLGTIYPLLPVFCKDFENGGMWLGAILSAQSAGVIIGTVLVGILSDMFGRKRLGLYSMFGDGVFFFWEIDGLDWFEPPPPPSNPNGSSSSSRLFPDSFASRRASSATAFAMPLKFLVFDIFFKFISQNIIF